jgi:hypothetical protein
MLRFQSCMPRWLEELAKFAEKKGAMHDDTFLSASLWGLSCWCTWL